MCCWPDCWPPYPGWRSGPAGYGQRLMYGSDQMAWPDAIGMSIERIEKAPFLSEAQKQDIFYNNAARFYGLKEGRP